MIRPAAALLAGVAVLAAAGSALARPDARTMTCAALNALVDAEGAVVVTTGPSTYERFVASRRFCDPWETTRPVFQLTADERQCVVHSICVGRHLDFGDGSD